MSRIENGKLRGLSERLRSNSTRPQVLFSSLENAAQLRNRQQELGLPVGGSPVEMPGEMLSTLYSAARASYDSVIGKLTEPGSVTRLLERQAPHLGSIKLNVPEVNQQLENRLRRGWRLPLIFDVLYTVKDGKPKWAVSEIQTAIWHVVRQREFIRAAGYDPESSETWLGEQTPYDIFKTINQETRGEEVTIIDMDPTRHFADHTYMARALGGNYAISPLDINTDEQGYFYKIDTDGKPLKVTETSEHDKREKKRIHHVIDRMGQLDLDELDIALQDTPLQRELIIKFMKDPSLNWVHHASWHYIIEKQTMKDIRDSLIAAQSPYSDLYVPIFAPDEQVAPGTYIVKPTDIAGGKGHSIKQVALGESFTVPKMHVAQEEFIPFPVPIHLEEELEGTFPTPADIPQPMVEYFGWDRDFTPGTLEVRLAFLPGYGIGAVPTAKLAPRWAPGDERKRLQANLPPVLAALKGNPNEAVSSLYTDYLPFGAFLPVVRMKEQESAA